MLDVIAFDSNTLERVIMLVCIANGLNHIWYNLVC